MAVKHVKVSGKADGTDATLVQPSDWNTAHNIEDATITEAKLSLSDVTTKNASASAHGLLPKLSGVAGEFLSGAGTWAVPAQATAIVNADIDAGAAIAVTKLAKGTALQTLRTNSAGTAVEWGIAIHVGNSAPASPSVNDIWIDTTP